MVELESTKKKIEEGYELSHQLPWGNWKEGFEGLLIEHKGNDYVRLYPTDKHKTTYFVNDKEMTYDELKESGYLVNSFFNKNSSETVDTVTIKVVNITNII